MSLTGLMEQAGLKFQSVGEGEFVMPFHSQHWPTIPVGVKEFPEGEEHVVGIVAPLLAWEGVKDLRPLLRLTVEMDVFKVGHSNGGVPLLIAEAPAGLMTPPLFRRLSEVAAAIADFPRQDFYGDGWRKAATLTRAALRTLEGPRLSPREAAKIGGWEIVREGEDRLTCEVQGLKVVLRQQGSLAGAYALTDTHPRNDQVFALALHANVVANVAKVGLDSDGDLAFAVELPAPQSELDIVNAVGRLVAFTERTWPMLVLANEAPQRRGLLGWLKR